MGTAQAKSTWFIREFKCPNCQGTNICGFIGTTMWGRLINPYGAPHVLVYCDDCSTVHGISHDQTDSRVFLEAVGNSDFSGCPVCGQ